MRQQLISAAALVLACGCADPTEQGGAIAYDPCQSLAVRAADDLELSPVQRDAIGDALAMWRAVLPGAVAGEPGVPISFEPAAPFYQGIYLPDVGAIVVNARIDDRHELAVTVAHELGHAFGLAHAATDHGRSVMVEGNRVVEPTAVDVADLVAVWGACVDTPSSPPMKLP